MKSAKTPRLTIRIDRRLLPPLMAGLVLGLAGYGAHTEQLTLSTYYPAPFGVYQELRATGPAHFAYQGGRVGIGTTRPRSLFEVDGTALMRRVGIGTSQPIAPLDVAGNAAVSGMARMGAAVVNRLVIQPRRNNPPNPQPGELWLLQ